MKQLKWGETPWDDWTREQLLREVQRMFMAVGALGNVVRMSQYSSPDSPYWGKEGTGGRALEMERQISLSVAQYEGEDLYRSFFRYAGDLLFDQSTGYRTGHGWVVCPECNQMIGDVSSAGQPCNGRGLGKPGCSGTLRRIEWSDLAKRESGG